MSVIPKTTLSKRILLTVLLHSFYIVQTTEGVDVVAAINAL